MNPHVKALRHVTALSNGPPVDPALAVTLNFHPDRWSGDRPILTALAEDGVYRSQFVTGTSNGGLTAHPEYRGQEYVDLGTEIAVADRLTPRVLGEAARTGRYDEQALKRVWHHLARFGNNQNSHSR
ncbi:DUF3626 domain-containing protein [Streptomyces sp. NBC_01233]|uniref:DUF3626 domain-containing protein n=1 Tax=Streptomyces sp. NBC_01233 TaxID=2903787 RepID=UPI002E1025C0|nr:DUF3626 domain-containing protein [Streptomyces sp. NBC_01233]